MSGAHPSQTAAAWPVVALIIGAGVISACQVGKASMALKAVQGELQLGLGTAAWLMSAFAVIGAVAGAPIGLAVDRIGARRMALCSLVVMGIGSALGAFSSDAKMLLATRVFEGLGFLGLTVAAPTLIAAAAPASIRGRAMALWAVFMPVGMTVVFLSAPLMSWLTWRGFWLFNAGILIGYAALLGWAVSASESFRANHNSILGDIREAITAPGPWVLGGLFVVFSCVFFALFSFLPTLLAERLGVSDESASLLSAAAIALSGVGNIVGGQLLTRGVPSIYLLTAGFSAMVLGGIGVFSAPTLEWGVYALCVVFAFASGFVPVVIFKSAPDYAPHSSLVGATLGFAMQGNNIGLLIGPVVAGGLVSAFSWSAVSLLISVSGFLAVLLLIAFQKLHVQPGRRALQL
ncbi:MFS transporter [Halomonas sp. SpR8]|uniref:MFS transporter n=1 Tax=Halomonas sp. SpR8 TaxID=3050463 RepID=UPI0027E5B2E9|nr:MFS transporter [Halomonas sp. SpR8]MDQ7730710.1 MFS transporter [Halomonas sp. SpR8]